MKTVFISYRQAGIGKHFARNVKMQLESHGYDVFLDVEGLRSGQLEEQIFKEIPRRLHFLLLLTPGALDRCRDEGDCLRREVESALSHGKNVIPILEESVELEALRETCPAPMKGIFLLNILKFRHETFDKDIERLIEKHIREHKPSAILPVPSKPLANKLLGLRISVELRDSVRRVLSHPKFPCWMSIGGEMARNPVWETVPQQDREAMLCDHQLDGPSPPMVMHLDMLLIRRNNSSGRGELWTYVSHAWGTNLIYFRPCLPEDGRASRNVLNANKLAKYTDGSRGAVVAKPLPGKYVVSAKQNPETKELTLYIIELWSVLFTKDSVATRALENPPVEIDSKRWIDLDSMRADPSAWSVNADVIHAIHRMFGVSLGPLPLSFPSRSSASGNTRAKRRSVKSK